MEKLSEEYKAKIEAYLYPNVLLMIEGQMFKQERLDRLEELSKQQKLSKKDKLSKPDMAEQRLITINRISGLIKDFAQENNLEISVVKDYLMELIEHEIKTEEMYSQEHIEAKQILLEEDVR